MNANATRCRRVKRTTTILPKHEYLTPCSIQAKNIPNTAILVEPFERFRNSSSLLVAHSLVLASEQTCFVRIMNVTRSPETVYEGCRIAQGTIFDENAKVVYRLESETSDDPFDINKALNLPNSLSPSQKSLVIGALKPFEHAFSKHAWDLGKSGKMKHKIRLKENAKPVRLPYRGMNPHKKKDLKEKIVKMQEVGLIEPTHSEWAAPTLLVPKKDGSFRLVVDYRKLNEQTIKTCWPLPRINDILDVLTGSCFFSTMDLASGYFQMEIEDSQDLTAFITPFGLFKWLRMPMGLCNAPGAFQNLMELILSGLNYEICMVYLDDIIVFGRTFEEHLTRLREVPNRIADSSLKLSPKSVRSFKSK